MIKSKLEIFDATTVYAAFTIEMVFLGLNNKSLESLGGIIILFLLIKILRIVKGYLLTLFCLILNFCFSFQLYLAFIIIEQKNSLVKIHRLKNRIVTLNIENNQYKFLIYNSIYYNRLNYPFNFH
jgi:hypothetical protein